jgi:hypothetical protein
VALADPCLALPRARESQRLDSQSETSFTLTENCQLAGAAWELLDQCVIGRQPDSMVLGGANQCTVRVELLAGLCCDKDPHSR